MLASVRMPPSTTMKDRGIGVQSDPSFRRHQISLARNKISTSVTNDTKLAKCHPDIAAHHACDQQLERNFLCVSYLKEL